MPLTKYVPDPENWARYFEKVSEDKEQSRTWRKGGEIISIDTDRPVSAKSKLVRIEAVTPVERIVEQAKSELRRQGVLVEEEDKKTHSSKRKRGKEGALSTSKRPKRIKQLSRVQATSIKVLRRGPEMDTAGF